VEAVEKGQVVRAPAEATLGWLVADFAVRVMVEGVGNAGPVEPGL